MTVPDSPLLRDSKPLPKSRSSPRFRTDLPIEGLRLGTSNALSLENLE